MNIYFSLPKILLIKLLCLMTVSIAYASAPLSPPEDALKKLMIGNERYVQDLHEHPNRDQAQREFVAAQQNPFAVIVSCSDSRVIPEIIFDQGIGDLFVVRVAGNVIDPVEIASILYGVDHLKASLVMVLGHENCGAVNAVLAHQTADIMPIAKKIEQAIKIYGPASNISLEEAIKANVKSVVNELKKYPEIIALIKNKKVDIVGGYYHLSNGKVELCCDK